MSKKIENKDLVQGNPFQPTQDQAVDFKKEIDNLNTSLNQTSDEFKEMLRQGQKLASSQPLSGYDNIHTFWQWLTDRLISFTPHNNTSMHCHFLESLQVFWDSMD